MIRCFIFLIALCFAMPAMAQLKFDPLQKAADNLDQFTANTNEIIKDFDGSAKYDFTMRIPNGFIVLEDEKLKNIPYGDSLLGVLFYAYGPAIQDVRPFIEMRSYNLDRRVSARDWFVARALKNSYTIRGLESHNDDKDFEVFYVRLDKAGNTEIVRAKGYLHDETIVMIEYVLPMTLWDRDQNTQIRTIESFGFSNDFKTEYPEKLTNYSYLDSFYIDYPKKWILKAAGSESVNRFDMTLVTTDINNFVFADIDLTMISTKSIRDQIDQSIYSVSLPDIIRDRIKKISDLGLATDKILESKKFNLTIPATLNITEVYPLRKKQSDIYVSEKQRDVASELWLTIIKMPEKSGKSYIVSMVVPSRDKNFYQWAIASQAYKTIIQSIR